MGHIEFRVLGRVEVLADGDRLDLGPPRRQTVLGALLWRPNEVVTRDSLTEAVWWRPPVAAHANLRGYLTGLRRLLDFTGEPGPRVQGARGGYRLRVGAGELDLDRFEELAAAGERALGAGRLTVALERFERAGQLWRGRALDGLAYGPGLQAKVARLEERRLTVLEQWAQTLLCLGHYERLSTELRGLVAEWPLRERFWAQLMLALHRSGRQAEAHAAYARVRAVLAEELGVDPGSELRRLHERLLRGDPDEAPAVGSAATAEPTRALAPLPVHRPRHVPALLPAGVAGFTGRRGELGQLDELLPAAGEPTGVVVCAVSGSAGVGKTSLAVRWAHRVAQRFPDGQLYANLRGFDPGGSVMTPEEALHRFLEALGVPPEGIPVDRDARAGLYRSLLADRRILVLLDNARDAEQIRPLLPGAPGSLVLVTSRDRLSSLVAVEGARPLLLDVLSADDARRLLTNRLGAARTAAEPVAVDEIVARCARLPLALAIVAARAATNPRLPLATLAEQLRRPGGRLDALTGADAAIDVRAVFSCSYRALSARAARLFRLLGLHPGPDIAIAAVASLAAVPPERVGPLLAELVQAHLVDEHVPGRYTFHDLLRAYAAEQARRHDAEPGRAAASRRLVEHYLHTAHAADLLLDPHRPNRSTPAAAGPDVRPESFADHEDALAWFTAERQVLLAATARAADAGLQAQSWQLALALGTFLDRRGHWHDQVAAQGAALRAAQRLGDPAGLAHTHRSLGRAHARLQRFDDAESHFRQALHRYRELGDPAGEAHTCLGLAFVCEQRDRRREALDHTERALELYQLAGHPGGQANALNNLGWYHARLGDHQRALAYCGRALELLRAIGDRPGEAGTWDSIGYAHHCLGEYRQAVDCYAKSVGLYRDLGDRYYEAGTLAHLGDSQYCLEDPDAARKSWEHAVAILDELGHPDADQVRDRLHRAASR